MTGFFVTHHAIIVATTEPTIYKIHLIMGYLLVFLAGVLVGLFIALIKGFSLND